MASIEQTRVQKIKKEAAQNLAQVRFNESLRHGINSAATLYTLTSTTDQPDTAVNGDVYYNAAENEFYVYHGNHWALDTSTRFKRSGVLFTGPNADGVDSLYQWKSGKLVEVATGSVEGASPIESITYIADSGNRYTVVLEDGTTYEITMTIPDGGGGSGGANFIKSITHKEDTTYTIVYTDVETSEITMDLGDIAGFNGVVIDDSAANQVGTVDVTGSVAAGILTLVFKNLKGQKGDKGDDGVGIESIRQTVTSTTDHGRNQVTVELTNGTKSYFYFYNGSKGSQGERGVGISNITGPTVEGNTAEGQRKTYTIVYDDGRTKEFTVKDGARGQTGVRQGTHQGSVNFTNGLEYGYTTATVDSDRRLYVDLTLPYSSQLYKDINEPWNSEIGASARSVAGIEDYFVNTDSGILYKRKSGNAATSAGWEEIINLHAIPDQVNWNSTIYLITEKPSVLDNYNPGDLLIVGGTGLAYKVATNDGEKQLTNPIYLRGSLWSCGQDDPNGVVSGYRGDFYMNKGDYYVYRNTSSTYNYEMGGYYGSEWTKELCLRAGGASYTVWGSGDTLPSTTDYTEGDYFLNTSDYYIYKLINGAWEQVVYTRGPQGIQGETGRAAGFDNYQVAEGHRLANGQTPRVEISSLNSDNTAKRFKFDFYIPDGEKGDRGDKFLVNDILDGYDKLSELTPEKSDTYYIVDESDLEHNGHLYQWNGTKWLDLGIVAQGATGPQGEAATIEFRNVNTGEAGTEVSIVEAATSTATHRIYDITIPRGYQGETGAAAGFAAEQLAEAHKLDPGQSPRVEITPTNFDDKQKQFKFDFYIPSGAQGERGDKFYVNDRVDTVDDLPADATKGDAYFVVGDNHIYQWNGEKWVDLGVAQEGPKGTDGEAATIAIAETRTGEPGTEAKVEELSGSTAQNRRYRITIPRGADGTDGIDGIDGIDGTDGVDALVCKELFNGSITSGSQVNITIDKFSRTPVVNDTFVLFTSSGEYSIATISSISNDVVTVVCGDVVTIKGADGEDGEDGLSIVDITKGSVIVDGTTTTTPITFTFSDQSTKTIDIVVENGKDGKDGKDGIDGIDGTTFTPSVDAEGNLSWTNDGGKANPPTVKIVGKDGEDGEAATIAIVETETGNAGTNAKVEELADSTPQDRKYRVTIPKGADGTTFTPSIDAEGNLSWTNDGGKENPATVKIVGENGKDGQDGKTPVKGEDYWTPEDKQEIVEDAVEEIKNQGIGGGGNLALAYAETIENADGTTTLNVYDDDDFLWNTPPNCIMGSIKKGNEQKIYFMKMYGGN